MTVLVFGETGQVARSLKHALSGICDTRFLGRGAADLTSPDACATAIADIKPQAVINAAAYTAVDRAEDEPGLAMAVNGDAPGAMARASADLSIPILHISTDYVFDGKGEAPFSPDDPTAPLGVYGRTKLAGERQVQDAGGQWLILRTSWVFSSYGQNFVKTMLRLGRERDTLRVVDDQVGGPTPAAAIADALAICLQAMLEGHPGGLHHFAGAPDVSWAGFAAAIMEQAGLDCGIEPIPTSDYPTPAARPENSRLDCSGLQRDFGIPRPDWSAYLSQTIKEIYV